MTNPIPYILSLPLRVRQWRATRYAIRMIHEIDREAAQKKLYLFTFRNRVMIATSEARKRFHLPDDWKI